MKQTHFVSRLLFNKPEDFGRSGSDSPLLAGKRNPTYYSVKNIFGTNPTHGTKLRDNNLQPIFCAGQIIGSGGRSPSGVGIFELPPSLREDTSGEFCDARKKCQNEPNSWDNDVPQLCPTEILCLKRNQWHQCTSSIRSRANRALALISSGT